MADETSDEADARNPHGALRVVADRWLVLAAHALQSGPARHVDLVRALGGVGHPVLTRTLRTMEAAELVIRTSYPEVPPRVEYTLTERGQSLAAAVAPLAAWAEANASAFPPEPAPVHVEEDEDDEFF